MDINKSDKFSASYPDLGFGFAYVKGCSYFKKHPPEFKSYKRQVLKNIRQENHPAKGNISFYEHFFTKNDYPCPLPSHYEKTIKQGLPNINLYVDTHITTEMNHGVLTGIQDYDKFIGDLVLDIADDNERFQGMRNIITCKKDEIVVRDEEGIVASLLQGPDQKTAITPETKNLVIYAFMVPNVSKDSIQACLDQTVDILNNYGEAKKVKIKII